jgi:hypothetical protein
MQINMNSATLENQPIALTVPREFRLAPARTRIERPIALGVSLGTSKGLGWEEAAWLILTLSSLATLALCF